MPSKKKSKPSFQVPEELQAAPQAGWVYRSDGPARARGTKTAHKSGSDGKAAAKSRQAGSTAAARIPSASPRRAPAAKPETAPERAKESASGSRRSFMNIGADAMSAGFGTAGNFLLLTTRMFVAPLSLGKRLFGF